MIAAAVVFAWFAAWLVCARLVTGVVDWVQRRRREPIGVVETPDHVVSLWSKRRRPFDYERDDGF